MSDYKPGTVAHIRIRDMYEGLAICTNTGGWAWVPKDKPGAFCGISVTAVTSNVRPLVVLDLDALPVRPTSSWRSVLRQWEGIARRDGQNVDANVLGAIADQIEQQTKPPKPEEPRGDGAVVEDANGRRWVRVPLASNDARWFCGLIGAWSTYADIDAVRVLSEGVRP